MRYVWSEVYTGAYGHSIALPNCCSVLSEISYHDHMAGTTNPPLYRLNSRVAIYEVPDLKLVDISIEVFDILLWSDEIRSVAR